jgi:hypothetical protein
MHKAESIGTVGPVVWEEGGDENITASYPICTPGIAVLRARGSEAGQPPDCDGSTTREEARDRLQHSVGWKVDDATWTEKSTGSAPFTVETTLPFRRLFQTMRQPYG